MTQRDAIFSFFPYPFFFFSKAVIPPLPPPLNTIIFCTIYNIYIPESTRAQAFDTTERIMIDLRDLDF